jgi:hypothetical protein
VLALDIDNLGVIPALFEGEINIIVILINNLYVGEPFGLL